MEPGRNGGGEKRVERATVALYVSLPLAKCAFLFVVSVDVRWEDKDRRLKDTVQ